MYSAVDSAPLHILHGATRLEMVQKSGDPVTLLPTLFAMKNIERSFFFSRAVLGFMKCSWDLVGLLCTGKFDDMKCLLTVEQAKTKE